MSEKQPPLRTGAVDPLLKDLNEKKQNFRRNVVSLAVELKEVRGRLASQEQCVAKETLIRQEAEMKAKKMEEEIIRLQKDIEERNVLLQSSTSGAEMYAKELDDLRLLLSETKITADASAASAQSAQLECSELVKEIVEKNNCLKEHEIRVNKLGEQLDLLQKDLRAREYSQKQLKDEVSRFEHDIMQALACGGSNKDSELRKILEEVCPRNYDKMNKLLVVKDGEIGKLRDEIRFMFVHWKLKTKELESELEKHRRTDQELKKKVVKLEFYLNEARSQTRKLLRMTELRNKALKELREDRLESEQTRVPLSRKKQNFWESPVFKIATAMSMLILVMLSKR